MGAGCKEAQHTRHESIRSARGRSVKGGDSSAQGPHAHAATAGGFFWIVSYYPSSSARTHEPRPETLIMKTTEFIMNPTEIDLD